MAKGKSILSSVEDFQYTETAPKIDSREFQKVIDSRRSVRIFDGTPIPEDITMQCLRNGLLAPNSSNLQPCELYWVTSPEKKKALIKACLFQVAAKKAAELIVVTARTATWRQHAKEMVAIFSKAKDGSVPKSAIDYYKKLVPFVYTVGVFSIFGFIKRIMFFFIGLKQPITREPVNSSHIRTWAVKSTALAAENIMLSFRAYGFDSCPMEGYDSKRIKKILDLPCDSVVVMVIAAGKRGEGGIYGPQLRYDSKRFIKKV
jgi:nitroreductase